MAGLGNWRPPRRRLTKVEKPMRNAVLIMGLAAMLAGMMSAEERAVDLSGTWILDPDRSQIHHTTPYLRKLRITENGPPYPTPNEDTKRESSALFSVEGMEDLVLKIVQTDAELKIERTFVAHGGQRTVVQKLALDGSQCINPSPDGQGGFISRASWRNGKLLNSGEATIEIMDQRTEINVTEEYSISGNGRKLTIKTLSAAPHGVSTFKLVFHKELVQ